MDNTFLREAIEKIEELTDSAREPHLSLIHILFFRSKKTSYETIFVNI